MFEPNVRFFMARLEGIAVGCGGVAMFDDYAEVKRMYTRLAARRWGSCESSIAQDRG
jgi:putative acetyltransferase